MIGRDADVLAVAEHLSARRFVTLRGPGGIGKTTVAVTVAHELGSQFRDGVRFLELASLKDPHLVVSAAASALGLVVPVEDPTPLLLEALRDRQLLMVLDSCEHVVEPAACLAEQIYQYAPSVSILATSRESLQAAGEFVFELTSLDIPPEDFGGEAELVSYPSTQLFMACAAGAGYAANLSDADAEIVAKICRKLDGVPLAIELVASRVSAHGLDEVDELIEGRLRLAWRGRRTAPVRHQTLSAALDWSYDLISPNERTLLQRLSVFPGPFTLQGARAIAGDLDQSDAVVEILEHLVLKSLVMSRPSAGQARFQLLETTRAYAAQKLAASGGARPASLSHTWYVLQALRPRTYEPGGERPGGWANRAELVPDARAALTWTYSDAGEPDLRMPIAAVCARLFLELNLLEECCNWAGRALREPENPHTDQATRMELLWAFGHAATFTGREIHECEAALQLGLELAQQLGHLQNQFRILSRLHALYRRTGNRRRLLEVALLAEAVANEIEDPAGRARAQTYIGIAYHLSGDQRLARHRLQAGEAGDAAIPSLPVDHFASPRGTHIMSCTNLWLLGLPDQAVALASRLMEDRSNPDLAMYCGALCFAARVYRWTGDLSALEEAANRLAGHSRKHGFGPFHTISLALRGELHVASGAVDEGVEILQQVLPRVVASRSGLYSGAAALALVEGLAAQGRLGDALDSMQVLINNAAEDGESWDMPELLRVQGELRWRSGDLPSAERDLHAAIELAERQSALSWRLRAAMSLTRIAGKGQAAAAALSELRHTYERFAEGFDTADLRGAQDLLQQLPSTDLGRQARPSRAEVRTPLPIRAVPDSALQTAPTALVRNSSPA
jgi:predicted ATPase